MKKTGKILVLLSSVLSVALLGCLPFTTPPEGGGPTHKVFEPGAGGFNTFEASWLIGHHMSDTQNGYLGQISSLVIDNTNDRIALVVISDVPYLGAKELAIPYGSITRVSEYTFKFNPGDNSISAGIFNSGGRMPVEMVNPGAFWDDEDLYTVTHGPSNSKYFGVPSAITPEWVAYIYRHYGQEPYWTQKGGQPLKDLELYQNTKLMGAKVQTPKGEEVARVNDLVINSSDWHIVFVVLSDVPEKGDALVAVPFVDLSRTGDNIFVVNTTRDQLRSAPSFDEAADLNNLKFAEDDYRYFGQPPCWTGDKGGVSQSK